MKVSDQYKTELQQYGFYAPADVRKMEDALKSSGYKLTYNSKMQKFTVVRRDRAAVDLFLVQRVLAQLPCIAVTPRFEGGTPTFTLGSSKWAWLSPVEFKFVQRGGTPCPLYPKGLFHGEFLDFYTVNVPNFTVIVDGSIR